MGLSGFIYKTTNGGQNWFQQSTGTNNTLYSISMVSEKFGYIVGDFGSIFYTSNGGTNWIKQNSQTKYIFRNIHTFDSVSAILVGDYGTILGKNFNLHVGIQEIGNLIPVTTSLSQNYPNPFNPVTKIKFDIPLDSRLRGNDNVILKIYDILGREVTVLVNEQLKPGTYEVEWNGSNYPSGVYFYKLITTGYTELKKMVLIK